MALNEMEQNKLNEAEKQIDIAPVYLDDTPALSIQALQKKAMRLASDFQIKLIVIDYLQLMNMGGIRYKDMNEELTVIVRSLKILAKDLNIPVIVLSSCNRGEAKTDGGRPQLHDLSESIEQDADVICFINRPERYRFYIDEEGNDMHGMAEIIVAKNRNGSKGRAFLRCFLQYSRFYNRRS